VSCVTSALLKLLDLASYGSVLGLITSKSKMPTWWRAVSVSLFYGWVYDVKSFQQLTTMHMIFIRQPDE